MMTTLPAFFNVPFLWKMALCTGCFFAPYTFCESHGRCVKHTMLLSAGVTLNTWEFCVELLKIQSKSYFPV